MAVLGIAADAPAEDARRLLASLASEYVHLDTPPEIIETEVAAVTAFRRLVLELNDDASRRKQHWVVAEAAAEAWKQAASSFPVTA